MKELKLKVIVNKPIGEVFEFSINPNNTPKWIEGIVKEETSEWPLKLGTTYRNQNTQGEWSTLTVTDLVPNEVFELSQVEGAYHVHYTFTALTDNSCELEYREWVDEGEISDLFTQETLDTLKKIIEEQ